jgi:predicted RNA-binding protein with PIN domain
MNHFIIDGYNALFSLKPYLKGKAQTREGFLLYLKTARPFGSLRNIVTVVFDGREGVVGNLWMPSFPLRIIFSKRESADEAIVRIVSREKHSQQTVVVTDDRELAERVRLLGARAVPVSVFFSSLTKKQRKPADVKPTPDSNEGKSITDEMKKEWKIDD